jgi:hypothetical protein
MDDKKEKPGLAFWGIVAIGTLLLYPLSFGPACWLSSCIHRGQSEISFVYQPLMQFWWGREPGRAPRRGDLLDRFTRFASKEGWTCARFAETGEYRWLDWGG